MLRTGVGRKCEYRLLVGNVLKCGKAEVGRGPENGKLPLETFRLVGANITKHLTARIRSEAEVQNISLKVRSVLEPAVPGAFSVRGLSTHSGRTDGDTHSSFFNPIRKLSVRFPRILPRIPYTLLHKYIYLLRS